VIHEWLARERPEVADYRADLAFTLAGLGRALHRAGRSALAVEPTQRAIALLEAIPTLTIDSRFDLARDHALLASIGEAPHSGLPTGAAGTAVAQAMAALRRAVAAGYRNADTLRAEADLAVLRDLPELRLLLLDVAFPRHPLAGAADASVRHVIGLEDR
jgi:hypothetical protein